MVEMPQNVDYLLNRECRKTRDQGCGEGKRPEKEREE